MSTPQPPPTSASTTTSYSSSPSQITSSRASTPTSTASPTTSLPLGAKAGIAIGDVVGALALALLAYIAYSINKKNSTAPSEHRESTPECAQADSNPIYQMHSENRQGEPKYELAGAGPWEGRLAELHGVGERPQASEMG